MKMKNLLIGGMSLALVACISIGGTLAYLQATDTQLKNTFTFANNITVDLYEYQNAEGSGDKNQTGHDYDNLVPGQSVVKNVDVTLTSAVKTDLYILIDKGVKGVADQNVKCMEVDETQITANGWTKVEITNEGKLLYKRAGIANAAGGQTYGVFETVKAPDALLSGSTTITLKDIKIDVFAVQSDSLGDGVTADSVAATNLEVTLAD